jgi:hypothetical protein
MKPLIFLLLGATVDVGSLLGVAGVGIAAGLVFMFVIRPVTVFLTLSPFLWTKQKMNVRELLFLSFVRETGVIPAVLLVGLRASGVPGADTVVAVGLWIILLTLVVQPPLTPLVAKFLGIAKDAPPFPKAAHAGTTAALVSRGDSYVQRLPAVADWAGTHAVRNVVLLHCPEAKYSESVAKAIRKDAAREFATLNAEREKDGKTPLRCELILRPGLLQDNIEALLASHEIAALFVGSKMLDYRLADVKRLRVPFVFLP